MGNTYTIQVWGKHFDGEYSYMVMWSGEYFDDAIEALNSIKERAKTTGWGCVTLEWR